MIAYTTLGTNDLDRATAFYDSLLGVIGAKRVMKLDRGHIWASAPGAPMFAVLTPFDGEEANVGNGTMVALAAGTKDNVDALHAKAMELGCACEGKPGPRGGSGFYFAYFRDLDGNKLAAMAPNK
jgi:catechol 2,3-dioxygenase-like lactoylglutathione lyase family enzyme